MFVLVKRVDSTPGVMYTRWGRAECPNGATLLYEGLVGGTDYRYNGGVSNFLCLPLSPEYVETESIGSYSSLYSTEYETNGTPLEDVYDYDVPCVVCLAPRTSTLMVPATPNCPDGLTLEYSGYLMGTRNTRELSADVICVDSYPETMLGSEEKSGGALLNMVTVICGLSYLPCEPYKDEIPLSCAVCSY